MPWLVAVAARRNIEQIRDAVRQSCSHCYIPLFRERITVRHKKIWRDRWLFDSYFFLRDWVKSPAISRILLGSDLKPALVGDEEIHRLRSREVAGYIPVRQPYRDGDRVRVADGPLQGITGTVAQGMVLYANGISVRIEDQRSLRPG